MLRGEREVHLRVDPERAARPSRQRARGDAASLPADSPQAQLFERLRSWRADSAREQGVPPYVVFHDSTLHAIAELRPADLDALAGISGIGRNKLERYGEAVLAVVNTP